MNIVLYICPMQTKSNTMKTIVSGKEIDVEQLLTDQLKKELTNKIEHHINEIREAAKTDNDAFEYQCLLYSLKKKLNN